MEFASRLSRLPIKRFYKYILRRFIGSFLKRDLDLDQLDVTVQLSRGVLELRNLELEVAGINELLNKAQAKEAISGLPPRESPIRLVDGILGYVKMEIPWSQLLKEHCKIYVEDLHLTMAINNDAMQEKGESRVNCSSSGPSGPGYHGNSPSSGSGGRYGNNNGSNDANKRQFKMSQSFMKEKQASTMESEGVETLSRLVQHVIGNTEICVKNIRISLFSEDKQTNRYYDYAVQLIISSALIFSDSKNDAGGDAGGLQEDRKIQVTDLALQLVNSSRTQESQEQDRRDALKIQGTGQESIGNGAGEQGEGDQKFSEKKSNNPLNSLISNGLLNTNSVHSDGESSTGDGKSDANSDVNSDSVSNMSGSFRPMACSYQSAYSAGVLGGSNSMMFHSANYGSPEQAPVFSRYTSSGIGIPISDARDSFFLDHAPIRKDDLILRTDVGEPCLLRARKKTNERLCKIETALDIKVQGVCCVLSLWNVRRLSEFFVFGKQNFSSSAIMQVGMDPNSGVPMVNNQAHSDCYSPPNMASTMGYNNMNNMVTPPKLMGYNPIDSNLDPMSKMPNGLANMSMSIFGKRPAHLEGGDHLFQSFIEPKPAKNFWYELYSLFEADANLEDETGEASDDEPELDLTSGVGFGRKKSGRKKKGKTGKKHGNGVNPKDQSQSQMEKVNSQASDNSEDPVDIEQYIRTVTLTVQIESTQFYLVLAQDIYGELGGDLEHKTSVSQPYPSLTGPPTQTRGENMKGSRGNDSILKSPTTSTKAWKNPKNLFAHPNRLGILLNHSNYEIVLGKFCLALSDDLDFFNSSKHIAHRKIYEITNSNDGSILDANANVQNPDGKLDPTEMNRKNSSKTRYSESKSTSKKDRKSKSKKKKSEDEDDGVGGFDDMAAEDDSPERGNNDNDTDPTLSPHGGPQRRAKKEGWEADCRVESIDIHFNFRPANMEDLLNRKVVQENLAAQQKENELNEQGQQTQAGYSPTGYNIGGLSKLNGITGFANETDHAERPATEVNVEPSGILVQTLTEGNLSKMFRSTQEEADHENDGEGGRQVVDSSDPSDVDTDTVESVDHGVSESILESTSSEGEEDEGDVLRDEVVLKTEFFECEVDVMGQKLRAVCRAYAMAREEEEMKRIADPDVGLDDLGDEGGDLANLYIDGKHSCRKRILRMAKGDFLKSERDEKERLEREENERLEQERSERRGSKGDLVADHDNMSKSSKLTAESGDSSSSSSSSEESTSEDSEGEQQETPKRPRLASEEKRKKDPHAFSETYREMFIPGYVSESKCHSQQSTPNGTPDKTFDLGIPTTTSNPIDFEVPSFHLRLGREHLDTGKERMSTSRPTIHMNLYSSIEVDVCPRSIESLSVVTAAMNTINLNYPTTEEEQVMQYIAQNPSVIAPSQVIERPSFLPENPRLQQGLQQARVVPGPGFGMNQGMRQQGYGMGGVVQQHQGMGGEFGQQVHGHPGQGHQHPPSHSASANPSSSSTNVINVIQESGRYGVFIHALRSAKVVLRLGKPREKLCSLMLEVKGADMCCGGHQKRRNEDFYFEEWRMSLGRLSAKFVDDGSNPTTSSKSSAELIILSQDGGDTDRDITIIRGFHRDVTRVILEQERKKKQAEIAARKKAASGTTNAGNQFRNHQQEDFQQEQYEQNPQNRNVQTHRAASRISETSSDEGWTKISIPAKGSSGFRSYKNQPNLTDVLVEGVQNIGKNLFGPRTQGRKRVSFNNEGYNANNLYRPNQVPYSRNNPNNRDPNIVRTNIQNPSMEDIVKTTSTSSTRKKDTNLLAEPAKTEIDVATNPIVLHFTGKRLVSFTESLDAFVTSFGNSSYINKLTTTGGMFQSMAKNLQANIGNMSSGGGGEWGSSCSSALGLPGSNTSSSGSVGPVPLRFSNIGLSLYVKSAWLEMREQPPENLNHFQDANSVPTKTDHLRNLWIALGSVEARHATVTEGAFETAILARDVRLIGEREIRTETKTTVGGNFTTPGMATGNSNFTSPNINNINPSFGPHSPRLSPREEKTVEHVMEPWFAPVRGTLIRRPDGTSLDGQTSDTGTGRGGFSDTGRGGFKKTTPRGDLGYWKTTPRSDKATTGAPKHAPFDFSFQTNTATSSMSTTINNLASLNPKGLNTNPTNNMSPNCAILNLPALFSTSASVIIHAKQEQVKGRARLTQTNEILRYQDTDRISDIDLFRILTAQRALEFKMQRQRYRLSISYFRDKNAIFEQVEKNSWGDSGCLLLSMNQKKISYNSGESIGLSGVKSDGSTSAANQNIPPAEALPSTIRPTMTNKALSTLFLFELKVVLNKLALHVHPHMYYTYLDILCYFAPPGYRPPPLTEQCLDRDRKAFTKYYINLQNCLVQMPSERYSKQCRNDITLACKTAGATGGRDHTPMDNGRGFHGAQGGSPNTFLSPRGDDHHFSSPREEKNPDLHNFSAVVSSIRPRNLSQNLGSQDPRGVPEIVMSGLPGDDLTKKYLDDSDDESPSKNPYNADGRHSPDIDTCMSTGIPSIHDNSDNIPTSEASTRQGIGAIKIDHDREHDLKREERNSGPRAAGNANSSDPSAVGGGASCNSVFVVNHFELACGVLAGTKSQGFKIEAREVNAYVIDKPQNLVQTKMIFGQSNLSGLGCGVGTLLLGQILSGLGFAHVLQAKDMHLLYKLDQLEMDYERELALRVVPGTSIPTGPPPKSQFVVGGKTLTSFDLSLGKIAIHLCADTVQCIVAVVAEAQVAAPVIKEIRDLRSPHSPLENENGSDGSSTDDESGGVGGKADNKPIVLRQEPNVDRYREANESLGVIPGNPQDEMEYFRNRDLLGVKSSKELQEEVSAVHDRNMKQALQGVVDADYEGVGGLRGLEDENRLPDPNVLVNAGMNPVHQPLLPPGMSLQQSFHPTTAETVNINVGNYCMQDSGNGGDVLVPDPFADDDDDSSMTHSFQEANSPVQGYQNQQSGQARNQQQQQNANQSRMYPQLEAPNMNQNIVNSAQIGLQRVQRGDSEPSSSSDEMPFVDSKLGGNLRKVSSGSIGKDFTDLHEHLLSGVNTIGGLKNAEINGDLVESYIKKSEQNLLSGVSTTVEVGTRSERPLDLDYYASDMYASFNENYDDDGNPISNSNHDNKNSDQDLEVNSDHVNTEDEKGKKGDETRPRIDEYKDALEERKKGELDDIEVDDSPTLASISRVGASHSGQQPSHEGHSHGSENPTRDLQPAALSTESLQTASLQSVSSQDVSVVYFDKDKFSDQQLQDFQRGEIRARHQISKIFKSATSQEDNNVKNRNNQNDSSKINPTPGSSRDGLPRNNIMLPEMETGRTPQMQPPPMPNISNFMDEDYNGNVNRGAGGSSSSRAQPINSNPGQATTGTTSRSPSGGINSKPSAGFRSQPRYQNGTQTRWFIPPDEVNIEHDKFSHFVSLEKANFGARPLLKVPRKYIYDRNLDKAVNAGNLNPQASTSSTPNNNSPLVGANENPKLSPPRRPSSDDPRYMSKQYTCNVGEITISLYAGTDFFIDQRAKMLSLMTTSDHYLVNRMNRRRNNMSLIFKLRQAVCKVMEMDSYENNKHMQQPLFLQQDRRSSSHNSSSFGPGNSKSRNSRSSLNDHGRSSPNQLIQQGSRAHVNRAIKSHLFDVLKRRIVLCVKDFELKDEVHSSVFQYVLQYYSDERTRPRPSDLDMLSLVVDEMVNLANTTPQTPSEFSVDLRLLPLRLTVDQDVVDFLQDFKACALLDLETSLVTEEDVNPLLLDENDEEEFFEEASHSSGSSGTDEKIGERLGQANNINIARSSAIINSNTAIINSCGSNAINSNNTTSASSNANQQLVTSSNVIFQRIRISALLLVIDYRAKRLDLEALKKGKVQELINLLPLLEGLEVAFQAIRLNGRYDTMAAAQSIMDLWSNEINRAQVIRSLSGITPIRSFANIGCSLTEFVKEPFLLYMQSGDHPRSNLAGNFGFGGHSGRGGHRSGRGGNPGFGTGSDARNPYNNPRRRGGAANLSQNQIAQQDLSLQACISRSLIRGTTAFLKNLTIESINLTEKAFSATQGALEYAEQAIAGEEGNRLLVQSGQHHHVGFNTAGHTGHAPHSRLLSQITAASNANRSHYSGVALPGRGSRTDRGRLDLDDLGNEDLLLGGEDWTSVSMGAKESVQPNDVLEGFNMGVEAFRRSVTDAARVAANPIQDISRGAAAPDVLKSAARGVPVCILKPVIGATNLAATTLRGARNAVDADRRDELVQKYKVPRV